MELIIKASEKEIAGLVLALQDRPEDPSEAIWKHLKEQKEWLDKLCENQRREGQAKEYRTSR